MFCDDPNIRPDLGNGTELLELVWVLVVRHDVEDVLLSRDVEEVALHLLFHSVVPDDRVHQQSPLPMLWHLIGVISGSFVEVSHRLALVKHQVRGHLSSRLLHIHVDSLVLPFSTGLACSWTRASASTGFDNYSALILKLHDDL